MRLDELRPVGQELTIRYPNGKKGWVDGEETDLKLSLVSADSKQFHAVVSRHAQDALSRAEELPIVERQHQTAEQIAACVVGWTGLEDSNGPIPYSHQKAIELMLNPELAFIREQVESFVVKRANFFRASQGAAGTVRHAVGELERGKLNGSKSSAGSTRPDKAAQEGEAQRASA